MGTRLPRPRGRSVVTEVPDDRAETPPAPARLATASVDEFVREWLRFVYRRPVGHRLRWAADWWNYDEAVNRLTAMWRSWETLRQDPGVGTSPWYRDHADYHMSILLSPDGPFAGADGEQHTNNRGEPLPYTAPPEGMFPDERELAPVSAQQV